MFDPRSRICRRFSVPSYLGGSDFRVPGVTRVEGLGRGVEDMDKVVREGRAARVSVSPADGVAIWRGAGRM